MWVVYPTVIDRADPTNGKVSQTIKLGCDVCFGACDLFSAAQDGSFFWALHYGGIGENKCTSNDPWANVGYALRRIRPGNPSVDVINVSSILSKVEEPNISVITAKDNKVFMAVGTVIHVIDADKSNDSKVDVIKTILPGIHVEGMLFANDTLWVVGDALIAINPNTYAIGSVYPLAAHVLAFDGKRMWGLDKFETTLQSVDLATRELSEVIPLPDELAQPTALGFDGKALWIAYNETTLLVKIPVK